MKQLNISLVSYGFPPNLGGVETSCYEIAWRLASINGQCTVITYRNPHNLPQYQPVQGLRIHRIEAHGLPSQPPNFLDRLSVMMSMIYTDFLDKHLTRRKRWHTILVLPYLLLQIQHLGSIRVNGLSDMVRKALVIHRERPQIVHAWDAIDLATVALLKPLFQFRLVAGYPGVAGDLLGAWLRGFEKLGYCIWADAYAIHECGTKAEDYARRFGAPSILTFYSGGTTQQKTPADWLKETRTRLDMKPEWSALGVLARIDKWNGIREIVQAFAKADLTDTYLLLIGPIWDQEYARGIKQDIKDLGQNDTIKWVGGVPHDDVAKYMDLCNLWVFNNLNGNLGLSLTENLTAGKLCIVGDTGERLREVVSHCGSILFRKNDIDDLAAKLVKGLESLQFWDQEAAMKAASELLSWDVSADALNRLYHSLLKD